VRLREADPPAPTLALVAAVALHEAATRFRHPGEARGPRTQVPANSQKAAFLDPGLGRDDELQIKWPNDLLAGSAKLAGILLERQEDAVVIGIGVNLAHAPAALDRPTTSLAALNGAAPEAALFLDTLAQAFARSVSEWRSEGLPPIRTRWLAAAHPHGTSLSTPAGEGLFEGVDETGALRLRLAAGTVRVIHAGDVFLI
jgi:BirA family biotin operon repressor/biotin-[acetyl-CoA-carboxylase] ligase